MLARRMFAVLVGLLVPPAGVYPIHGLALGTYFSAALFVLALGVFFLLAALPGMALWILAVLHALVVALSRRRAVI